MPEKFILGYSVKSIHGIEPKLIRPSIKTIEMKNGTDLSGNDL